MQSSCEFSALACPFAPLLPLKYVWGWQLSTQVSYLQPYELTPQDTPEQLAVDVRK